MNRDVENVKTQLEQSTVVQSQPLLTDDEHACMDALAKAASLGFKVIGSGPSQGAHRGSITESAVKWDGAEWAFRIHACQQMILAQAAARAFPEKYRLLGGWV